MRPIKIAILALGGEGGGVLADWIVDLAEHNGYFAQTTSVPGVAQRTGATIYYVEMFPQARTLADGAEAPVLALMPLAGDVDIVLASELMEAGRAVQRGFVTPERTILLGSTHRVFSMTERTAPDDGRVDADALRAHVEAAARRCVMFDMAALAESQGCAISAVLFGVLAAHGETPFTRAQFAATIERAGVGVAASLKGFEAALAATRTPADAAPAALSTPEPTQPATRALVERARASLPPEALATAIEGLRRLVDYQDTDYAGLYLDRLDRLRAHDATLQAETARHLALWMSYEDTIRVADLKTRAERFERVRGEVRVADEQLLAIGEFMHPRLQEICDTLPAKWGRWLAASGWPRRWVERLAARGRVVRTSSLRGYLLLAFIASLRGRRRDTLRFEVEQARIEAWLADVLAAAANPALAIEIVRCQSLVRGYGDTHERGWAQFEALRTAWRAADVTPASLRAARSAAA